jgi:superfamily II DNA or RNA helicase
MNRDLNKSDKGRTLEVADITLYPHNQTAYDNLNTALRYTKHTAVIQPTGTGKSFIALKYINDHKGEKVVYLSPSSYIFDQLEVHAEGSDILANTELITYQKLIYCSIEEIRELMAKHIITDEFHRCGADEWGRAVRQLLAEHPAANVIGFSATPIRYLDKAGVRDMTEELFHGSVANYYSLRQAMEDGILPHPKYVLADIYMADKIYEREQRLESIDNVERRAEQEAILQEMRRYLSDAQGIDQIFKDHLPSTHAKLIVFCQNLEHIDQAKEDMEKWLTDIASVRCYTCRSDEDSSDAELDAFIADADQTYIRLLFAVNMLKAS